MGCGDAGTAAEALRAKDVNALLEATNTAAGSSGLIAFAPSLGSPALARQSADSPETGRFLPVPVLFGGTQDELRLYAAYDIQAGARITAETYPDGLRRAYGTNADAVAAAYPSGHFGPAPATLSSVMTEFHPTVGTNHCIDLRTADLISRRSRVHRFEFAERAAPMLGVALPATPDPASSRARRIPPNWTTPSRAFPTRRRSTNWNSPAHRASWPRPPTGPASPAPVRRAQRPGMGNGPDAALRGRAHHPHQPGN